MYRRNESDFYFTIQQRQFAAKIPHGSHACLLARVTAVLCQRLAQIKSGNQFCAGLLCNSDAVSDMIAMAVSDQNQVGFIYFGQVFFAVFVARVGDPWINQQHLAGWCGEFEGGMSIPGQFRIAGKCRKRRR